MWEEWFKGQQPSGWAQVNGDPPEKKIFDERKLRLRVFCSPGRDNSDVDRLGGDLQTCFYGNQFQVHEALLELMLVGVKEEKGEKEEKDEKTKGKKKSTWAVQEQHFIPWTDIRYVSVINE